jgi:twitching motility protein PilT
MMEVATHMLDINTLLIEARRKRASDVHLKVDSPPVLRIDGLLERLDGHNVTDSDIEQVVRTIATDEEMERFRSTKDLDLDYEINDISRFRVNVCRGDGHFRIVLRLIPLDPPSIEDLDLPSVLRDVCKQKSGLVLVTGHAGCGKSTTLAAMVDEINSSEPRHIITVEDPIEFVHRDKVGIITQRQVMFDTSSFGHGLRAALRQDPDVILIGEMRDLETFETALRSAETGHLVMSTLHTINAVESLNRIMDMFPLHRQDEVRKHLASVLKAIISQRLVRRKDGDGRVAAVEILIGNPTVREFIETAKSFGDIVKLMEEGYSTYGMQTFDQALYDLWKDGVITDQTALESATSPKNLSLQMDGLAKDKKAG